MILIQFNKNSKNFNLPKFFFKKKKFNISILSGSLPLSFCQQKETEGFIEKQVERERKKETERERDRETRKQRKGKEKRRRK